MRVEAHLSTPASSNDRGEGSGGEITRNILQDLPPSPAHHVTFHIADPGLCEFGLYRVHNGSDNVDFDPEVPNGNICGVDVGEGKGLLAVVRDVRFRFCGFGEQRALLFHVHLDPYLEDRLASVGSGHTESPVPVVCRRGEGEEFSGRSRSLWALRRQMAASVQPMIRRKPVLRNGKGPGIR